MSAAAPISIQGLESGTAAGVIDSPHFWRRFLRRPLARVCLAYLLLLLGVGLLAPLLLPGVERQEAGNLADALQAPSWSHLLGTDTVGRDVLARLLVGTRPALIAVAEAVSVTLLLGVIPGVAAGYVGSWLDQVASWLTDFVLSMPGLIVVLVVLTVFPNVTLAAMVTIGVLNAPYLMRVVRSATQPVRAEQYIAAAQVSGLSRLHIITWHVLPRIVGAVIVQSSLLAGASLLAEAGLAFLNLLAAPPAPDWGGMLGDGISAIVLQPWLIWPPGVAITVTVLVFALLGDVVRDVNVEVWSAPTRRRAQRPRSQQPRVATVLGLADAGEKSDLLSVAGLTVKFHTRSGTTTVVDDVTFSIAAGETVGLLGESGSGKSVTAMSILGLPPGNGEITGGAVLFEGLNLVTSSEHQLRLLRGKEISVISQEPMVSLNPVVRIGSQLADAVRSHHRVSRARARARAIELLRTVHIPQAESVALRYPHELSGGMAQRVAIARALAGEPKLLIADEPTTALDVTVQAEILALLRELRNKRRMAILLITHDWGVIADLCDRVIVMYAGQVVERADVRPIFREPLHPYTQALLASNPHNATRGETLPVIGGNVPNPGAWPSGCRFHPRCGYATAVCRAEPIPLKRPSIERETRCIHYDQLVGANGSFGVRKC